MEKSKELPKVQEIKKLNEQETQKLMQAFEIIKGQCAKAEVSLMQHQNVQQALQIVAEKLNSLIEE